jgi:hypothetical protein
VALPFTSVYPPLSALENVGINSTRTHKSFRVILSNNLHTQVVRWNCCKVKLAAATTLTASRHCTGRSLAVRLQANRGSDATRSQVQKRQSTFLRFQPSIRIPEPPGEIENSQLSLRARESGVHSCRGSIPDQSIVSHLASHPSGILLCLFPPSRTARTLRPPSPVFCTCLAGLLPVPTHVAVPSRRPPFVWSF